MNVYTVTFLLHIGLIISGPISINPGAGLFGGSDDLSSHLMENRSE